MKKAFSFKTDEDRGEEDLELEINGELFILDRPDEMTGIQLLTLTGGTATVAGVVRMLERGISDDDWERFGKTTAKCKTEDFYRIAGAMINMYAGNPTTAAADS